MCRHRPALEEALQSGFDLIISDYHLPSFSGLDALAMVREKDPHIPFILVSGTIGEQAAIESLKAGATDYLLKQQSGSAAFRRPPRRAGSRGTRPAAGGGNGIGPPRKIFPHAHGKFARRAGHFEPRRELHYASAFD